MSRSCKDGGRETSKMRRGHGAARAGWMDWPSRFVMDCVDRNESGELEGGMMEGMVFEGVDGVRVYSLSKSEKATVFIVGEENV